MSHELAVSLFTLFTRLNNIVGVGAKLNKYFTFQSVKSERG